VSDPPRLRRVRVLHILACDDLAGAELLVASYIERFDRSRFDVELATLAPPGPIAARLRKVGITVHPLGGHGTVRAAIELAHLIRRPFDLVNSHGFKVTMIARVLVRVLAPSTALVSSVHALHVTEVENILDPKGRLALALERLGGRFIDVYEVNTKGAIDFLGARGIGQSRLRYIPNGIDVRDWPLRRQIRQPGGALTIACVSRFVPRKRQVDLVRALAHLRAAERSIRAVFVGYGPTLEPIRSLVKSLGLNEIVEFRGRTKPDEIRAILANADIFCLPTLWEGTVISVMEAMATGLPVVASDVNGVNEVVDNRVTGILVPPCRDDLLAEAIDELLADPALRRKMGAAGRRRVESEFGLNQIVRRKEDLYSALTAGLRTRR
jgi:glycosyltransferase involved in cell wall biosynthesis